MADELEVSVYQDMLDWGWRRSGTFLYKVGIKQRCSLISFDSFVLVTLIALQPLMPETCCCAYTIRLDVTKFQPNKRQRKLLSKLDNLTKGEVYTNLDKTGKTFKNLEMVIDLKGIIA